MPSPVTIPESVSLAFHAMGKLAAFEGEYLRLDDLLVRPGSPDHLSKVLQKLVRAGLIKSKRGRNGGFTIAVRASDIRLIDVWITLEGSFITSSCPLAGNGCSLSSCVFGTVQEEAALLIRDYFTKRTVADIGDSFREEKENEQA